MFWSNVGRRSLWREMDRFQRELNSLMDGLASGRQGQFPPLNIWASDEHALITAELPGIDVEELDVSVVSDTVTISGRRSLPETGDDVQWRRHERWHGEFSRTMQMPFRIAAEEVDATYRNGVLELTLPRAETDRPRRISVMGESEGNVLESGQSE